MNGSVNSIDASEILRIYALISTGKQPDLSPLQFELADTNSDGDISSADASLVLKYYSAISTGIFRTFREFLSEMT